MNGVGDNETSCDLIRPRFYRRAFPAMVTADIDGVLRSGIAADVPPSRVK